MSKNYLLTLLLLTFSIFVYSQSNETIEGSVVDKDTKEPLIGAIVVLSSDKSVGVVTDHDGKFVLETVPGTTLSISYIGYNTLQVPASKTMMVELVSNASLLDEVVVVGYGTLKKSDLTGALASVKGNDLTVYSSPNIAAALGGRASGVSVVTSGAVDGAVKVRVRGIGTINNSDPLYVVDGFPTGDISYVAPTDIESIEVLKDASATAIYGSRGANGVILITTKRGTIQKTNVNINTYFGMRTVSKYLDVLNASEYATAMYESSEVSGIPIDAEYVALLDYALANKKKGTDWQKEVSQTGVVQNYNISVNGGSDAVKYNLSATYNSEEGVMKNTYVDKLFLKFNTDYKLTQRISLGTDLAFTDWNMSDSELGNMYGAALSLAARMSPVSPIFKQNGEWEKVMAGGVNAARVTDFGKYRNREGNKFLGNFFINVDILKGLTFKTSFGADYTFSKSRGYYPVFYVSQQERDDESSLVERRKSDFGWVWSNVANYLFDINKVHSFNLMAGTEATYGKSDEISAEAYDVSENVNMQYISAAKSNKYWASSGQSKSTIFSMFLRANYSFDNRYLFTGTIRSDASSRFSKDNRVGIFPSLSTGWNVMEESFMKDVPVISQLKLRAGWGQVGNQGSTGIGEYLSLIDNNLRYVLGDKVYEGRLPLAASNPNLKWEIAEQVNVGVDLALLNSKLQLNVDYFEKKTKDMIVREPLPLFVGARAALKNVGDMQNKGVEITANYDDKIGDFTYAVGANISFIKNEVTNLGRVEVGAYDDVVFDRLGNTFRTQVGYEVAYYRGYKTDGVFNTQEELDSYVNDEGQAIQPNGRLGGVKFVDYNEDGRIDENDLTYLGSYMPDFSGGFNLNLGYKNISLSLFADFVYGNEIANMNTFELRSGAGDTNILRSYYNNRWTPETPNNNEPNFPIFGSEEVRFSDRYVEDGSFLRIRNVQLAYHLPQKWLKKVKINQAKIFGSVDNLVTFTKYTGFNPEIPDQYGKPLAAGGDTGATMLPRTYTVGLSLNF